jgi:hypothetical protein
MKIVLATPLYPPDIAQPAPYVKELAKRLGANNEVTIVAYGRLPEKVPGVTILVVDKRSALPIRLFKFLITLVAEARKADILYAQNGASVELPLVLATFFMRTPVIFCISDKAVHKYNSKHALRRLIEQLAERHSRTVVKEIPPERPEILPFGPQPTEEQETYETAWEAHLEMLRRIFNHGK